MTRRASSWWADEDLELDHGDPTVELELDFGSTGSRRSGGLHERSDRMDRLARLEARVEELARAFGEPVSPAPVSAAARKLYERLSALDDRLSRIEGALEATAEFEALDALAVQVGDRWRRLDRALDVLFALHDCGSHVGSPAGCPICAFQLEYAPPEPEPPG